MPSKSRRAAVRYTIDTSAPVNDNVMDPASFEKFLLDNIKVDGKKLAQRNAESDPVTIRRDEARITVTSTQKFAKRYLKYLSKRYLKKQQLRDYLRVVSTGKSDYTMRYFNINAGDDGADDQ